MPARLLRIPQGLSEAQHRAASKRIAREGLDGLCMTYLGGAYGPVWSGAVEHDLGFLRFYPGLRALEMYLPAQRSLDALAAVEDSLEWLDLGELERADLAPLARCTRLATVCTVRNTRGAASLADVPALKDLTLWSYPLAKCGFVRAMPALMRLCLGYGTAANLELVRDLPALTHMTLDSIGRLEDVSALSTLTGLEVLRVKKLKKLSALPPLASAAGLRAVVLTELGALRDLSALSGKKLEELVLTGSGTLGDAVESLRDFRAERCHVRLYPEREQARARAAMRPIAIDTPLASLRYVEREQAEHVNY